MICTILCLMIAVGPHILTCFSMMHTYAGLPLIAVIVANGVQHFKGNIKLFCGAFILFLISAIVINLHLLDESYKSGIVGKQMAQEAVKKTGKPVRFVKIIIIEDDYPKLSSFCVIPNEAFGWGIAAKYETNYKWPETISDTTIVRSSDAVEKAREMAVETLNSNQYDCVWIVNH